ncbi:MAG: NFACT RNA binding domain-containing protein, partial [Desulfomonilaceae bacterium]
RLTKSLVENLRREICKPIRAKIRGLVTRIQKIENDEQKLKSYIEHGKWGELLKSVIGNFKKGMTFVEVNEWQSGTTVKISLDPSLDLVSNMRKFFAHSAKGKRGIVITKERLEKTIQEKMALEELLYFLEEAKTQEELEILSSEIHLTKRLEFHPDKKNKKNPVTRGKTSSNYLEFKSPSGFNVFVGRNSLGNDFILRTKVKPEDIWFHVNNAPGSHVAMISRGNENFPDQDIYFGATLAAKHSKLGKAGKIEVIYTMVKNVSRIKGGFLGQVKIGKHNTVVVDLGK